MNPSTPDWKRKLAAYLHDPPSKCLDIATHGERSDAAFRQAGFTDTEVGNYFTHADHTAAAADRLPFPKSQPASLSCHFDGIRNAFHHPLDGGTQLPFHDEFRSVEQGFEGENSIQPALKHWPSDWDETTLWRARFFAHWRCWPQFATQKDYRLGLLPADTRIPDHSIWAHMQVVSALAGCEGDDQVWRPAFLKFQLGPVQDFIAAARSIRDLWSGSYLLSWLMAAGLKKLSELVGPDAVIFPNLRGQPLFDLHWKKELWDVVTIGDQPIWNSFGWSNRDLLTPNLPNVFLAVVPAAQAADVAQAVCDAIQAEWKQIADAVWAECEKAGLTADEAGLSAHDRKTRFDAQVARFLSLSWQVTPWPDSLDAALKLTDGFDKDMPIQQARARVLAVVDMAEKQMPLEHRDGRFYVGGKAGPKEKLNNLGLGWSIILALNSWQLDAVRQTRAFSAANAGGWQVGTFNNKDALTGREEAVAGGKTWGEKARKTSQGPWASLFKHDDWLSAPTLIKRIWHFAYLAADPWKLKTDPYHFPMPNTRGVAGHEPEVDCGEDETADDAPPSEKYFAVLAFDGDEIGKWISGEKTPPFATQLADYTDHEGNVSQGSLEYFQRDSDPDGKGRLKERFADFVKSKRPLSPSYHLQFSEALSNFALLCARPIVEAFDGRLIYAGGDDVVALLPADTALDCAQALRMAFRGDAGLPEFLNTATAQLKRANEPAKRTVPYDQRLAAENCSFESPAQGFLARKDLSDQTNQKPIPFLVPGPAADCSVGLAIAHFKAPLQDVVRAAQTAEKRAKKELGRSAVAVTLMKRSGEIIEWGAKWQGGLELYRELARALEAEELSAKFPHRLIELLEAYITDSTPLVGQAKTVQPVAGFPVEAIIRREFEHCLNRQRGPRFPKEAKAAEDLRRRLGEALTAYLGSLPPGDPSHPATSERLLRALIGLCQTVAFAHRTTTETNNHPEPKGNP